MKKLDTKQAVGTIQHLKNMTSAVGAQYPTRVVVQIGNQLNRSERTVWRYLRNGVPSESSSVKLNNVHLKGIARAQGRLKNAWRQLHHDGAYTKGYRQFVRDFQTVSPVVRHGLTAGVKAGLEQGLYLKSQAESRLDRVIFDHTMADIRIQRMYMGKLEMFRPWISLLLDSSTRTILAAIITEGDGVGGDPNTESLVALLATSVRGSTANDGTFVGGLPRVVQCDNAKAHVAEAMISGFTTLGVALHLIKPGSPWEDGKVERLMRTMKEELLSLLPGCTAIPAQRYNHEPWEPEDCLTIDQFQEKLVEWIDHYNFERVHTSLKCTPFEAWSADPTPIQRVSDAVLHFAFLAESRSRIVGKNGVHFRNIDYTHPDLKTLVGRRVTLRYLPNDSTFVEVLLDDVHFCTAVAHSRLTPEDRQKIVTQRANDGQKVNRLLKQSRKRLSARSSDTRARLAPERDPNYPNLSLDLTDPEEYLLYLESSIGINEIEKSE